MKIAMMTPWNATCGVSVHAELVGREWVKAGHELEVFAPVNDEMRTGIKDEEFVTRCWTVDRGATKGIIEHYLDPEPFLNADYEFFVVQDLEITPMRELLKIWPQIKKRAKTIWVTHESSLVPYPEFYLFDFDAIVCFDERYWRLLRQKFPEEKIHVISFPCHPWLLGHKEEARQRLSLPQDKKVIFVYGLSIPFRLYPIPAVAELARTYDLLYLAISAREEERLLRLFRERYDFLETRHCTLALNELYTYLHAADALLIYNKSPDIVISSMVYLCLGSGCPILINEGRYTEDLGEEVLKYRDFDELKEILAQVFRGRKPNQEAIEKFIAERSAPRVASLFIDLGQNLTKEK